MFKEINYITIPGFALTRLGLSGNELICYSLIYGFSQAEGNYFTGSLNYLAKGLNVTKRTAIELLARLEGKGLIRREEEIRNNVKYCKYQTVPLGDEEISPGVVKKFHQGGEEISQNQKVSPFFPPKEKVSPTTPLKEIPPYNPPTKTHNIPPLYSPQGETTSKNFKNQAQAQPTPPVPAAPLPFASKAFADAWAELCALKKWAKKPQSARDKALKKLGRFSEWVALKAIEDTIIGDFQGIFPEKYANQPKAAPQQQPEEAPKYKKTTIEELLGGKK